jgi:RNA recognition motif-containing protein
MKIAKAFIFVNIYLNLAGLGINITEEILYKHFLKFGEISNIRICSPKESDNFSKNYAFLTFYKSEQATQAKQQMSNKIIKGSQIKIKWGSNKSLNENTINPMVLLK